jgi:hypothetical protein
MSWSSSDQDDCLSPKTTEPRDTKYSDVWYVVRYLYAIKTGASFYKDPVDIDICQHNLSNSPDDGSLRQNMSQAQVSFITKILMLCMEHETFEHVYKFYLFVGYLMILYQLQWLCNSGWNDANSYA